MQLRTIATLTAAEQSRLAEVREAVEAADLLLEVKGLHPHLDQIVGTVSCPYEGWQTRDLLLVGVYVFRSLPKSEYTAVRVAAEY